jgi:hypothetical protein
MPLIRGLDTVSQPHKAEACRHSTSRCQLSSSPYFLGTIGPHSIVLISEFEGESRSNELDKRMQTAAGLAEYYKRNPSGRKRQSRLLRSTTELMYFLLPGCLLSTAILQITVWLV